MSRVRLRVPVSAGLTALLLGALAAAGLSAASSVAAQPRLVDGQAFAVGGGAAVPPAAQVPPAGTAVEPGAAAPPAQPPAPAPTTTPTTSAPPSSPVPSPSASSEAPAPASPSAAEAPPATEVAKVVELVNAERARAGCRALTVDERLVASAQAHATDMAVNRYFSHVSQDGRTFDQRIRAAGYPSPAAENIAKGYRSPEAVMRAWMNSPGHRANILNCGLRTIGAGLDTRGWYWVQNFGR